MTVTRKFSIFEMKSGDPKPQGFRVTRSSSHPVQNSQALKEMRLRCTLKSSSTKYLCCTMPQALPSFVTQNAYIKEEQSFKKTVKEVRISQVPRDANVISSHVYTKSKCWMMAQWSSKDASPPRWQRARQRQPEDGLPHVSPCRYTHTSLFV